MQVATVASVTGFCLCPQLSVGLPHGLSGVNFELATYFFCEPLEHGLHAQTGSQAGVHNKRTVTR